MLVTPPLRVTNDGDVKLSYCFDHILVKKAREESIIEKEKS